MSIAMLILAGYIGFSSALAVFWIGWSLLGKSA
jgi:hypothetical protein